MQILPLLSERLADVLSLLCPDALEMAQLVRPTQDPAHGDFQINCAMPLAKRMGKSPRDVAGLLLEKIRLDDICQSAEIAGPGFINLKLRDAWICQAVEQMHVSSRLGVDRVAKPLRIVIDYSSPNVAKPMHVGHIRSTVIGDSLAKILRFLGHDVITDNHLGDWGTQFGMIIYGYRHFLDAAAFRVAPVPELLRIYRLVNGLIDFGKAKERLPLLEQEVAAAGISLKNLQAQSSSASPEEVKKQAKHVATVERKLRSLEEELTALRQKIAANEADKSLMQLADKHPHIGSAVLEETAKLHAGDSDNVQLWNSLLPYCMDEINRVYKRLNVRFDHVLGESFYHDMLPGVVERLEQLGLATESEGAICVFLEGFDAPMIVRKQDGAFLYSTTDLATLLYRKEHFKPDQILYVVDFRQGDHFQKLFAVAPRIGLAGVDLKHVSFGTVLDESGRPLKTRSGSLAGLEGLLDEAVDKAYQVVCNNDRLTKMDPPISEAEKREIAERVGIGAIKYADLAHHRTSDYKFSLDKMVAMDGNTAAYIQYAFARTQGVLRAVPHPHLSTHTSMGSAARVVCPTETERGLLLLLLRYDEVLNQVANEHAPNMLIDYLYELAKGLSVFYEHCPVLKAEEADVRSSRITIVTLLGRTLKHGLELLGIDVVARM